MTNKFFLTAFGCAMIASAQPSVVSISPLSGKNTTGTFTSVYHHPQGRHYLAYLLVLPTPNIVWFTAKGSCLVEYNTYSNGVRLVDDAGTGWLGGISGVRGPVLANNACSVNTAAVQASFSPATNNLTVTVPLTFNSSFTGPLTTFIQEADADDRWTGMTQFGTWNAFSNSTVKPGPSIAAIQHPEYSTLGPSSVTVTAGHTAGNASLSTIHILLADKIVGGANRCHMIYFRHPIPEQNIVEHDLKLVNDAGTGFAPVTPATATTPPYQGNSTCRIYGGSLIVTSGQIQRTIQTVYATDRGITRLNLWANAFDTSGNLTHWLDRVAVGP